MGAYIKVSLDEVQEPKAGMVVIKDHWCITPELWGGDSRPIHGVVTWHFNES